MKRNKLVKIDSNTHAKLKNYKRQIQVLEDDDVPLGEIIERMSKGDDVLTRLKMGAMERRRRK